MKKTDDHRNGETPNAEKYLNLSDEEKDIEIQKSIMHMHNLVYMVTHYSGRKLPVLGETKPKRELPGNREE